MISSNIRLRAFFVSIVTGVVGILPLSLSLLCFPFFMIWLRQIAFCKESRIYIYIWYLIRLNVSSFLFSPPSPRSYKHTFYTRSADLLRTYFHESNESIHPTPWRPWHTQTPTNYTNITMITTPLLGCSCTTMFFYRNKHIMVDLGTGNNNKINWALADKQEMIDIVEMVYRGARKGRGLVVSPKDYSTKYQY